MEAAKKKHNNKDTAFHFTRPRINRLFEEAMKYPLIAVYAGTGYGKTSAVQDFVREYKAVTIWVRLSERDNVGGRFWENFTHTMTQINPSFANAITKLGFPDTPEKLKQYHAMLRDHEQKKRQIMVFDDFHYIENPAVLRFVEDTFRNLPPGASLLLISRSIPRVNITGIAYGRGIFNISEEDLNFTESEAAQYFRHMNIALKPDNLRGIMQDTGGWAFALNLIARSYQKAPGYEGYLRNAMKSNIFQLMEIEIWEKITERLKIFLARLSLIEHLSVDIITLLAEGDKDLISELEKQNAYICRDNYINAYLIHPLFLKFLAEKRELLTDEQKRETYSIAGEWCDKNGFKIDALSYYEKISDYESIVRMVIDLPAQMPHDIACYATGVFERAPIEAFDKAYYLAPMHLRVLMCQGLWEETIELAKKYEARYINLPANDLFRRRALRGIYHCWAITREAMCLKEDVYDFDLYFEKLEKCMSETPVNMESLINPSPGPWICSIGSSRKGAPEEFIAALKRANGHISRCFNGIETGEDELACGELSFYKGDLRAAEANIGSALEIARKNKQFEIVHKALFYIMQIAVMQGNYEKTEQALKEMKAQLREKKYFNRYTNYDISLAWYYSVMGLPEKAPDWIKESFSPYDYATFIENFANHIKARYCYMTRNYPPLLSYIKEMKKRESYLFGRIKLLAVEACIYYKLKEKEKAYSAFEEAYKTASPNEIIVPFIELGKDMRTLTSFAQKKPKGAIPKTWLEDINRKSASYAKRLAYIASEYKQANNIASGIVISPRENEILTDLSRGLSRPEIAANRRLSINTVKMVISHVYMKLGAENLADAIRIAAEKKIV